jgi:uncharacterized membrane protein
MTSETNQTESDRLIGKMAWIVVSALITLVVVYSLYCFNFFTEFGFSKNTTDWGTFGDYVGGILNPIFSFLTLVALLLTLNLQRKQLDISNEELELSRDELKASREELKKSAEAQALTANALNEQTKYAVLSAKLSALNSAQAVVTGLLDQYRNNSRIGQEDYQDLLRKKDSMDKDILKILDEI